MERYKPIVRLGDKILFETGTRNAFRYKGEGEPDRKDLRHNWGKKWEPCRAVCEGNILTIYNRKNEMIDVYMMNDGKIKEPPVLVPVEASAE